MFGIAPFALVLIEVGLRRLSESQCLGLGDPHGGLGGLALGQRINLVGQLPLRHKGAFTRLGETKQFSAAQTHPAFPAVQLVAQRPGCVRRRLDLEIEAVAVVVPPWSAFAPQRGDAFHRETHVRPPCFARGTNLAPAARSSSPEKSPIRLPKYNG